MKTTQRSAVVGVFNDHADADRAVADLRRAGFREDQIGVATKDPEGAVAKANEKGTKWEEGAGIGILAGAGIGSLVGLGVLSNIIPVVGPVLFTGTMAVLLANAAGGAAIAGIVGALIGMGVPEEEAHYYEGEFKSGRTIVTVKTEDRATEALAIMQRYGAYNKDTAQVGMTGEKYGAQTTGTRGQQTMKLHEEELHARKQPVHTGEVRVHKEVVTEHKTLDVPVKREEVVIERRPVEGHVASSANIREGETIRIPVSEEKVRVEKEQVVKEEVRVGKRQVQETEHVGGTVRKEQVRVDKEGDVEVHDKASDTRSNKNRR